jgi:glycosyltransferase involved in cell wall biosynthesis
MAAGCVPIVVNKGGQREIVRHGVEGFLCNTLAELKKYTACIAEDEGLRIRFATAARSRAQQFSATNFLAQYSRLVTMDHQNEV